MVICQKCYIPMSGVMSFSKDKQERFCKCPKCRGETKRRVLRDDELDFREELSKAIKGNSNGRH